jgi:fructosamine-3-kinase
VIPDPVAQYFRDNSLGELAGIQPVGGGCINHGARLHTTSGATFFLKTNSQAPENMFAREAQGLEALRGVNGPRVPHPLLWGTGFLLLEDLAPATRRQDYWREFGRQLAALHLNTSPRFGFHHDNYLGSTHQPNPWTGDGFSFFAESRLLYQARLARRRGLLEEADVHAVESLVRRLPELVPLQPASLIHGDLWGGNAITDVGGHPALIDPAAHYGWAEAELAMTALFGAFPDEFYRAYQDVHPVEKDLPTRFPVYNLYHLLNHLNLFGTSYLGQVRAVLSRFS